MMKSDLQHHGIEPNEGDWDFIGEYDPRNHPNSSQKWSTFSVGVFQWVRRANGKGIKKGKIVRRISGPTHRPEEVYQKAFDEIAVRSYFDIF